MTNNRHSIRLKGFDYSSNGSYFITIDTWQKRKLFGELVGGKMILSDFGEILGKEIINTSKIRYGVKIPIFQIMPDHWHAIIEISVGAHGNAPVQSGYGEISVGAHGNAPVQNLGCIIRGIKMAVSTKLKIGGYRWQV